MGGRSPFPTPIFLSVQNMFFLPKKQFVTWDFLDDKETAQQDDEHFSGHT